MGGILLQSKMPEVGNLLRVAFTLRQFNPHIIVIMCACCLFAQLHPLPRYTVALANTLPNILLKVCVHVIRQNIIAFKEEWLAPMCVPLLPHQSLADGITGHFTQLTKDEVWSDRT